MGDRRRTGSPPGCQAVKEKVAKATSWETIREQRKQWWSFQPIRQTAPAEGEQLGAIGHRSIHSGRMEGCWSGTGCRCWGGGVDSPVVVFNHRPASDTGGDCGVREGGGVGSAGRGRGGGGAAFVVAAFWGTLGAALDGLGALRRVARQRRRPGYSVCEPVPNYLIRALNADVSYDQLLREHIAGDLLEQPRLNAELGLNELAIGPAHIGSCCRASRPQTRSMNWCEQREPDRRGQQAFLGLTVSCALSQPQIRCH